MKLNLVLLNKVLNLKFVEKKYLVKRDLIKNKFSQQKLLINNIDKYCIKIILLSKNILIYSPVELCFVIFGCMS